MTNVDSRQHHLVDWDKSKQEVETCPNPEYGHYYTMAIEEKGEIEAVNEEIRLAYK